MVKSKVQTLRPVKPAVKKTLRDVTRDQHTFRHVAIVYMSRDGVVDCTWSSMTTAELLLMTGYLNRMAENTVYGVEE